MNDPPLTLDEIIDKLDRISRHVSLLPALNVNLEQMAVDIDLMRRDIEAINKRLKEGGRDA